MNKIVTSKNIDGITDLVVVAPIKEGFIEAYENVTYQTRLRLVAEALHNVRVSAREYEKLTPFSDTTERILTLLNFRIGVLDKDLFQIDRENGLVARRYLYLAATFDGALEPYMRLIWRPLGIFLDLLFCNCEGYKPAGDHSFPEYFDWVRGAQVDSAIFYSTTGQTVREQIYLRQLERMQRELDPAVADLCLARMTMPDREAESLEDRSGPNEMKAHALALEALNVLYRLADYYPPDRLDPTQRPSDAETPQPGAAGNYTYAEGRYLLRATRSLLQGWESGRVPPALRNLYREQLEWYESGADLESQEPAVADPPFDPSQVQAGILTSPGSAGRLVRHGALLLMTVTDPEKARSFIRGLPVTYEGDPPPASGLYHSIAFTMQGLTRLGLPEGDRLRFPREFREGMEKRSGLLGDFRDYHPRRWTLPERNWPPASAAAPRRAPVEMSEVDFVVQLRYAAPPGDLSDAPLRAEIAKLAGEAEAAGAVLAAVEPMISIYHEAAPGAGPSGDTSGHFQLRDGISQPVPHASPPDPRGRDDVSLGEILRGHGNDRGDRAAALDRVQRNGSFLVIRKLRQKVEEYFAFLETESRRIARQHPGFTADDLAARLWGRRPDGTPLVPPGPAGLNDFDYAADPGGDACPHAAHIRRTNPRDQFLGRPAPRIMRRGMSFGRPGANEPRGVMFMAYCASIAEQFEVIQRWVNGANSTGVSAANNDPLVGVPPAKGDIVHRFVDGGKVIRTAVPPSLIALQWGLYLFAPSREGLDEICGLEGPVPDLDAPSEARGRDTIAAIEALPEDLQRREWKRILEDLDVKDPAERALTPDIWSAIRRHKGGSYRLPRGREFARAIVGEDADEAAACGDADAPSVVLVASRRHVLEVLSEPDVFSVEIQEGRTRRTSGAIYVAMQPGATYDAESTATNEIMFAQSAETGFGTAYKYAKAVLQKAIQGASALGRKSFKLELRRDFLIPTLGLMCTEWFGIPNGTEMELGGWSWTPEGTERKARCPGDFFSPSRHAFYPDPTDAVEDYAKDHGRRIRRAGEALVARCRPGGTGAMPGSLSSLMGDRIASNDVLARNIIGMMIGALPPVDGNLRAILYEWLNEKTLWRHQAALGRAAGGGPADYAAATKALWGPISRAMCKRPAPDLLLRRATRDYRLAADPDGADAPPDAAFVDVRKGDVVVVSLVAATQQSLRDAESPNGDAFLVFGGRRIEALQPEGKPFHACPAYKLMKGSMTGILAALLEVGQIKALPSSLIVEISDWP
jgi:hypothetical protein